MALVLSFKWSLVVVWFPPWDSEPGSSGPPSLSEQRLPQGCGCSTSTQPSTEGSESFLLWLTADCTVKGIHWDPHISMWPLVWMTSPFEISLSHTMHRQQLKTPTLKYCFRQKTWTEFQVSLCNHTEVIILRGLYHHNGCPYGSRPN